MLVHLDWQPSDRQLRQFAGVALVALPLLSWYWGAGAGWIAATAAVGGLLGAVSLAAPQWLRPVYVAALLAAAPIGLVVGEVVMVLVFCGAVLPVGLLRRCFGRPALERRFDAHAATYWDDKPRPRGAASYLRQF